MKRILLWLQPDNKYFEAYFQKDNDGREVYYPWGAGDGYYISEVQKRNLKRSQNFLFSLFFIFIFSFLIYLDNTVDNMSQYNWISVIIINICLFIICSLVFRNTRQLEPKREANLKKLKNPIILKDLFGLWALQVFLVSLGLLWNPDEDLLKISSLFVMIFYPTLMWFVWYRKGYIFQPKPPPI